MYVYIVWMALKFPAISGHVFDRPFAFPVAPAHSVRLLHTPTRNPGRIPASHRVFVDHAPLIKRRGSVGGLAIINWPLLIRTITPECRGNYQRAAGTTLDVEQTHSFVAWLLPTPSSSSKIFTIPVSLQEPPLHPCSRETSPLSLGKKKGSIERLVIE